LNTTPIGIHPAQSNPADKFLTELDGVLEHKKVPERYVPACKDKKTLMQIICTPHAVEMNMIRTLKVFVAGQNET